MGDVEERILELADEMDAATTGADGLVELGTGVVIRPKALNQDTFLSILARFPEPLVPVVYDAERGRSIENHDDPDYLDKVKWRNIKLSEAVTLATYALGVEVVSIPDDFPGPEDEDWLDERAVAGLSSGDSHRARLMDWLRHKATVNTPDRKPGDNARIMRAVGRLTGTVEADVSEAAKSNGRAAGRGAAIRGRDGRRRG